MGSLYSSINFRGALAWRVDVAGDERQPPVPDSQQDDHPTAVRDRGVVRMLLLTCLGILAH